MTKEQLMWISEEELKKAFLDIVVEYSFGDISDEDAIKFLCSKTDCTEAEAKAFIAKLNRDR